MNQKSLRFSARALLASFFVLPSLLCSQAEFDLDDFDLATGDDPIGGRFNVWEPGLNRVFQNISANQSTATYVESEAFEESGNEQLTVTTTSGGFVFTALRYIGDNIEGPANDPLFSLLETYPVIEFEVKNEGAENVSIQLFINTNDGFEYNGIDGSGLVVLPGNTATYRFNLGDDPTYQSLASAWQSGNFDLRIIQSTSSGTPSKVSYDDFRLVEAVEVEGKIVLEDYDNFSGFFDQFNGNNATYSTADHDSDGDEELEIAFSKDGFNMGLSRNLQRGDPWFDDLEQYPGFYFHYANLSDGPVTLGVVLANDGVLEKWPSFGAVSVAAGESGVYAYDLGNDPDFRAAIAVWNGGAGNWMRLRILQSTEDGLLGTVVFDDIEMGPVPPVLMEGTWNDVEIGSVYGYSDVWGYSEFLGTVHFGNLPWVYQHPLGWMYLVGSYTEEGVEGTSYWFYSEDLGYVYTNSTWDGGYQAQNNDWQVGNFLN